MSGQARSGVGEVRGPGRSPIAVASVPRTAMPVCPGSASAPSVSAAHPEVHVRGVGGGEAKVGAMRSMPSSGSGVQRGRDSAPTHDDSRMSGVSVLDLAMSDQSRCALRTQDNVPATDTSQPGRAQLARSGSSIAAPCGGLSDATRALRARVHSRHAVHPTLARVACITETGSAPKACIPDGPPYAPHRCINDSVFSAHEVCLSLTPSPPRPACKSGFAARSAPEGLLKQSGEGYALQGARAACISTRPFLAREACIPPSSILTIPEETA